MMLPNCYLLEHAKKTEKQPPLNIYLLQNYGGETREPNPVIKMHCPLCSRESHTQPHVPWVKLAAFILLQVGD